VVRGADEPTIAPGDKYRSTSQLEAATRELIDALRVNLTLFVWTQSADHIPKSIPRFAQRTFIFQTGSDQCSALSRSSSCFENGPLLRGVEQRMLPHRLFCSRRLMVVRRIMLSKQSQTTDALRWQLRCGRTIATR
jgi:hypothetical protein